MILTLRIKKKFFDLIKDGHKRVEYRSRSVYYDSIFESKKSDHFKTLKLHYQGDKHLYVNILKVKKTTQHYEIYLGRKIEHVSTKTGKKGSLLQRAGRQKQTTCRRTNRQSTR